MNTQAAAAGTGNVNFVIKPYDPLDEAIYLFGKFNQNPEESEFTETELISLVAHRMRQHGGVDGA